MKRIGFIVNPIAGMGGAVGLKGTDGKETLKRAIALGAKPIAPLRAKIFLSHLKKLQCNFHILAAAGEMGENEARDLGLEYTPIGEPKEETDSSDTKRAAELMKKSGIDLLVFCGGDGTARDIMDVIGLKLPVLGVPTGVKMHSAVFALNPKAAAEITMRFLMYGLPLREAEVMDVDEDAFRQGRLSAKLYGYMLVPFEPNYIQGVKMAARIIVTPIGGQGFIFGRGNQQISPKVIRRVGIENIIVICTKSKLQSIQALRVDTGDSELDERIRGRMDVIIDYNQVVTVPIK